jgi:S-adenosylmethionine:tRNA ribosyltransferase-isomerase
MTSVKQISIKDYHYDLPFERIAKYPLAERDLSKLLIYKKEKIIRSLNTYILMNFCQRILYYFLITPKLFLHDYFLKHHRKGTLKYFV